MTDKEIAEIYRQMELEIIASMKRNLALHEAEEEETGLKYPQWQAEKLRSLRQYRKENRRIFGKYTKKLPAEVQKQLKKELKQGYSHEIEKYRSIIGEDRYRSAMAMKDSFFSINTRKADALIKEIKGSLFKANTAALRMADDTYRQVITKTELFLTNGVYTEKQAYDMAVRDFLERGLNCIEYKDGRRVNIDDYASMAVRTASQRAYLIGEGEFRKQTGRTLIMISRHNTSCEKCRPFESKVLIDDVYSGGKADDGDYMLLSTAMSLGLFHPRCRHGCGTYFPELEDLTGYDSPDSRLNNYGEYDKAGNADKALQRQQHAQRMVQKYTRLTVGSADEQNIAKYQKRLDYWQEQEKALSQDTVDNEAESGIINIEKHIIVDGKNVVGKFAPRDGFDSLIDDIIDYQGYNGKPRIIESQVEFDKYVQEDHFIAERTIRAPDSKILDTYFNQMLCLDDEDYFYVNCGDGGAQYGQGMYCAADYSKGNCPKAGFLHEINQYGTLRDSNDVFGTKWLTLDPSAKILRLPYGKKADEYITDLYCAEYLKIHPGATKVQALDAAMYQTKDMRYPRPKNPGVLAAEMGYDAINAEGHGQTGSYSVVLNRTKVIFYGGEQYVY